MAAYNGGRFIETQLRSILPQLCAGDEIVIVDDASQDDTVSRIQAFEAEFAAMNSSPRVLLTRHESNCGVVQTFEDAIRRATGDVLFLCDDDDLWAPNKVEKVLEAFERSPEVQVVCTGLMLMDGEGRPMHDDGLLKHHREPAA
jgi:glycosyltransferase involved in cell wall biosynthesis